MKKSLLLIFALVTMLFVGVDGRAQTTNAVSSEEAVVAQTQPQTETPAQTEAQSQTESATPTEAQAQKPNDKDLMSYVLADSTFRNSSDAVVKMLGNNIAYIQVKKLNKAKADTLKAIARRDSLRVVDSLNAIKARKPFKSVIKYWAGRNRYGQYTEECAAHANARLCRSGIYSYGHAYQIPGHFYPVINGYSHITLPNLQTIKWENRFGAVLNAHRRAADYVKENLDISKLVKGKYYVVNMYYTTSPHMLEFFYAARRQGTGNYGTHIGVLYFDEKTQHWVVEHNIHGHVHRDALEAILGGKSNPHKYGVTSIARASK